MLTTIGTELGAGLSSAWMGAHSAAGEDVLVGTNDCSDGCTWPAASGAVGQVPPGDWRHQPVAREAISQQRHAERSKVQHK